MKDKSSASFHNPTLLLVLMLATVSFGCNRLGQGMQRTIDSSEAPLTFCDLIRAPSRFDGKTVRVRSTLIGYHELAIYDPTCGDQTKYIRVDFDPDTRRELVQKVSSLGDRGMQRGNFWVGAILVGRFEKVPGEDCKSAIRESGMPDRYYLNYCYRIVVDQLEKVEPVQETVAWPQ